MNTMIKGIYTNEYGTTAYLMQWTDGTWFVDMGCCLWNREYKTGRGARNYLAKQGFKEA